MDPMKPMEPMQPMEPMKFDDPIGDVLSQTTLPNSPQKWSEVIIQRQQNDQRLSISAHVPDGDHVTLLKNLQQALAGQQVGSIELKLV